jgi:very-short-patch-repair endonuclease
MRRGLNPPLPSTTLRAALDLRKHATDAETKLWHHLRAGRLDGLKFRRQHPLPPWIADFYCSEAQLVVEIDGSQHRDADDAMRTRLLEQRGLRVLRFWNNDALENTAAVLEVILSTARNRTLSPTPLPQGEGL